MRLLEARGAAVLGEVMTPERRAELKDLARKGRITPWDLGPELFTEIDRLESKNQAMAELLDQAPHSHLCRTTLSLASAFQAACDCWKREAQKILAKPETKSE